MQLYVIGYFVWEIFFILIFGSFLNNHVVLMKELNVIIFHGVHSFSVIAVGSPISRLIAEIFLQYSIVRNDCQGFNNLSYTIHFR